MRGGVEVSQSQEGREGGQTIAGGEGVGSAIHRRGGVEISQSQEGRGRGQPIAGGEGGGSANRRRGGSRVSQSQKGRSGVSQSQEGRKRCQPIAGEEGVGSDAEVVGKTGGHLEERHRDINPGLLRFEKMGAGQFRNPKGG
jgi:hypothetical protein